MPSDVLQLNFHKADLLTQLEFNKIEPVILFSNNLIFIFIYRFGRL